MRKNKTMDPNKILKIDMKKRFSGILIYAIYDMFHNSKVVNRG